MLYWFQLNPPSSSKSKRSIEHDYIRTIKVSVFQAMGSSTGERHEEVSSTVSPRVEGSTPVRGNFFADFYSNTILADLTEWSIYGKPRISESCQISQHRKPGQPDQSPKRAIRSFRDTLKFFQNLTQGDWFKINDVIDDYHVTKYLEIVAILRIEQMVVTWKYKEVLKWYIRKYMQKVGSFLYSINKIYMLYLRP